MGDTEKKIKDAIKKYNKYRSPEAKAKFVSLEGKKFKIEFTGSFCTTCGFHDYLDDYVIFLEEFGVHASTGYVKEKPNGAVVDFEIVEY